MTEGLRRSVDGDAGYSGLITKNPEHRDWEATWLTDHLYSLPELEEHLTDHGHMPPPSWQERKRKKPVGLGRNCTLFETARVWAYREIRHHWGDPEGLRTAIVHEAHALNAEFTEALPANEVVHLAESIHRWIVGHSRLWADGPAVYEATFSIIQSARSRKGAAKGGRASGAARRAAAQEKWSRLD